MNVSTGTTISPDDFKGLLGVSDPNYKNSDKSVYGSIQAIETDRTNNFGYKSNKTGFEIGTQFEYLDDFNLGLSTEHFMKN